MTKQVVYKRKPATIRNYLVSATITACGFLGAFSYAMFTGHLQRGIPYDVVKQAEEHVKQAQAAQDEHDMAAAWGYDKQVKR